MPEPIIDVAIVGAGPVGALAANLCGMYGLSAEVFERAADVYDLPRAAGLHDDAQRILHNAGVLDAVLPTTGEMRGAEFVDATGRRINGLEFPPGLRTPNGYPPLLNIHQPGLERAIRSGLSRYDAVALRVAHDVCSITPADDHVELRVRDLSGGGTRRVRARWLIGADGANSFVRKSFDVGWHSLGYDCDWLVVDVALARDVALPRLCQQVCDPDRPTTLIPMPGRMRRWEFQLRPGETREEMEKPEQVWALLAPWLGRDDGTILRAVVYRFHSTIAETFRTGRLFLAGDAAHQTPPFLGQGLCTGLRDVDNLIWKLAMVRRGQAGDPLLETYNAERRPQAIAMVEHSTNTGKLIDAYAAMAHGGPEPPPDLQSYAYGGAAYLPRLSTGLLALDSNPLAGHLLPHGSVRARERAGTFDDVVGPRWAIVAAEDPRPAMGGATRAAWEALGAAFVAAPDPQGSLYGLLAGGERLVVRPDRVLYGGASSSGFDALTARLMAALGPEAAPSPAPSIADAEGVR